ncbi:MAG: hypothetical protein ACH37Z_16585 [Anaerolineae bacterium]|jgi:hypothetical protein|nr:hypothetical protein [Ardenticatenia bacterium]MBK8538437.1 hypothetical protein [Ardenticatenia bacterium]HQZ71243.1 hypothetical protein [Anaerolineae bacterium]HRA20462.1 hypothetical protein [Anaerolineae bacterium]
MLYRGIGKTALIALLGAALAPYGAGAQGSPVKDLRLLDAGGQPMALIPIEAGDDYYRVPEGTPSITAAFEFAGTQATDVKIKVLGTEGVGLFEESKSVDAPGTYEFVYDAKDRPLEKGEYVVNLYLGKESYLADSVQLFVGDAEPQQSVASQQETAPANPAESPEPSAPIDAAPSEDPAGGATGNSSLLILAGAGILALLGIVLWAGRSAMRRG